ncbi:MAG: hypothetical protein C5B48_14745 [Candidatus Rokuibacteriota bacterium]|nr:MAG: hypothetical protein C5B48_14745 [Candidatus Rokubacteria bacterium]
MSRRHCVQRLTAIAALSLAVMLGSDPTAPRVAALERHATETVPNFERLWVEAQAWAKQSNAAPEDCVFSFRFDPETKQVSAGYAAACDEPYRSPFYPWPAPSRPGARFTLEDIRSYTQDSWVESGMAARPGVSRDEQILDACGVVVGFTADGRGAEAIECYWIQGSVMGRRANTWFLVDAKNGRVASRLEARLEHLGNHETKDILARLRHTRAMNSGQEGPDGKKDVIVRIVGKVISRELNRLSVWGRALPLVGHPPTELGVVTHDAHLVVTYPSDDALGPEYYLEGRHCFKERREKRSADGAATPEWVYGPCPLGPDQYWMFERYPPGRRTMSYGPYREYRDCDRERKQLASTLTAVAGHCIRKTRVSFRMIKDGTLVMPPDAPSLE